MTWKNLNKDSVANYSTSYSSRIVPFLFKRLIVFNFRSIFNGRGATRGVPVPNIFGSIVRTRESTNFALRNLCAKMLPPARRIFFIPFFVKSFIICFGDFDVNSSCPGIVLF